MSYRAIGLELGIHDTAVRYLTGPMGRTIQCTPGPKSADRCSRCGAPATRYVCGKCKSAATVAARRRTEARDPEALRRRREAHARDSRRRRAAERIHMPGVIHDLRGRVRVVRVVRGAIDTHVSQEQTISVRWILRVLRAIPLTPCWVRARRRQNRREMLEHLRRYYANGQ